MDLRISRFTCFLVLGLCVLIAGCEEEPVPAYLKIDQVTFTTVQSTQGPPTHNIKVVWVFADDQPVGVFEIPVKFPVLAEGKTRMMFIAGIMVNGISTTLGQYPFYRADTVSLDFIPATTIHYNPSFEYLDNIIFKVKEDFETGNGFSGITRISGLPVIRHGGSAGAIFLNDSISSQQALTTNDFSLPGKSTPTYVELDYINNNTFRVGMVATTSAGIIDFDKITVTPKADWNKIYIDLTDEATQLSGATFQLRISASRDEGIDSAYIILDNIKLIHLPD